MKDGAYQYSVNMTVPLGKRNGGLDIHIDKNVVKGFLTMFTETLPILHGSCERNEIKFSGKMKTLLNTFSYTAEGTVSETEINLMFHTERGDYPALGKQAFFAKQEIAHE